jgi:tRNA-dihydrouridine synthase A
MANRDIPPLQYARVYRLVTDFPHLEFEINGAISSPEDVHFHLSSNIGLKGTLLYSPMLP